ncbi:MAG: rod shape-determining protein MreC [Candidatus Paceibacterota bacterium]
MKLASKKSKVLVGILVISATFSLVFFQKEIKSFFFSISSPIQKNFWGMGDSVSGFFGSISEGKRIWQENEELKLKIQSLIAENVALLDLKKENESLRGALDLGLKNEFELSFAEIVSKDVSQDFILIDKGSKDGLEKGMPVITWQKALVGRIYEVYDGFSKVILISNKESSFDAQISGQDISGVVKGKGNLSLYLDFVAKEEEIKKDDIVITTALSGIFPAGILVGKISDIKKSDLEPFQEDGILPTFDLKAERDVFIITNYLK